MIVAHEWSSKPKMARYADFYFCKHCGASKHVHWTPGWPPCRSYYDAKGDELSDEPECVARPEMHRCEVVSVHCDCGGILAPVAEGRGEV